MVRELYPSLAQLVAPETLSVLEGRPVKGVESEAFESVDGLSGGKLAWVRTDTGERYVVKRFAFEWDWIMRITDDRRGRAVLAWQTGLLDRLPPEISHEVVACARDGEAWALLLRDASDALVPPGDDLISVADNERLIDAMAAMHAQFRGQEKLADPALGFCSLHQRYAWLTPSGVQAVVDWPDPIPRIVVDGWALLPDAVESDVAEIVQSLLRDPTPLGNALERFPQTVIHGDWKLGNLGIHRDNGQVVLLDWAVVGPAPGLVDLAWYLAVNCARLPVSKEKTIDHYRSCFERRTGARIEEEDWSRQLDLSLLGGFLQLGWPKTYGAVHAEAEAVRARERAELRWWSDWVRRGARWL